MNFNRNINLFINHNYFAVLKRLWTFYADRKQHLQEYPFRIRKSIRKQIDLLLQKILDIKSLPKNLDATDGLAAAVCHYYNRGKINLGKSSSLIIGIKKSKFKNIIIWDLQPTQ